MEALPKVPGPRLSPFKYDRGEEDLEFVRLLGSGVHADVWKVMINGKYYALKVFLGRGWVGSGAYEGVASLTKQEEEYYFAPFYRECRAYGRIKDAGREDLVVKCHGYILLGIELQRKLREKTDFDREEDRWDWSNPTEGVLLQALVKDLVHADFDAIEKSCKDKILSGNAANRLLALTRMDRREGRRLPRAVHSLHRIGILVGDIHNNNVVGGKFFDFSLSLTAPHPLFTPEVLDADDSMEWSDLSWLDAVHVDSVIEDWNEAVGSRLGHIWERAARNGDYLKRLRNGKPDFTEKNFGVRPKAETYGWTIADKKKWTRLRKKREIAALRHCS